MIIKQSSDAMSKQLMILSTGSIFGRHMYLRRYVFHGKISFVQHYNDVSNSSKYLMMGSIYNRDRFLQTSDYGIVQASGKQSNSRYRREWTHFFRFGNRTRVSKCFLLWLDECNIGFCTELFAVIINFCFHSPEANCLWM